MRVSGLAYFRCTICQCRFLDPERRPSRSAERAHYTCHQNHPDDLAYRSFLQPAADQVLARVAPGATGLDYGAGPGPALACMLAEHGYALQVYDPYFAPDAAALERDYDFITCTETVEHFHDPAGQFDQLDRMLRPGALLVIMTCFQTEDARFADWHYRRDPTHVVFYRVETFDWLGRHHGWKTDFPVPNLAVFEKPRAGTGSRSGVSGTAAL